MIAKYGEDNGRYLYEELTRYRSQPAPLRQRPGPRRPAHPTPLISTPSVHSA